MKEKEEKQQNYTTVSIPMPLAEKIDETVKEGSYQNRADFVRAAIRKLLSEVGA